MIRIQKLGHIGLYCKEIKQMTDFYTNIMGFEVSDTNERGMVFLRYGSDHHTFVLAPMPEEEKKKGDGAKVLQQIALEVADLEELKKTKTYPGGQRGQNPGKDQARGAGLRLHH